MSNRGGCKGQVAVYHGPLFGCNTRPPVTNSLKGKAGYGCDQLTQCRLERLMMRKVQEPSTSLTREWVLPPAPTANNLALESRQTT